MKGRYLALYDEVIRRGAELDALASNSKSFLWSNKEFP